MISIRQAGTTAVIAAMVCFAAAYRIAPAWVNALGLDLWSLPALHEDLEEAQRQNRGTAEAIAVSDGRHETKVILVENLLNDRTTLREVVVEFQALNRGQASETSIRRTYPGASDDEKTARNVLEYTRHVLADPRGPHGELPDRLLAEFHDWFGTAYVATIH